MAESLFVARWNGYRIDVFTPSIDFSWEAERTRVRHAVDGRSVWFLSAAYVRAHIAELLGPDDERVATWDKLWTDYRTR